MFTSCLFIISLATTAQGFCGSSIRWSHDFNMDDVFGIWYGVGYAQHTPDMTNKPNEVGCVTLYITDDNGEREDELEWSIPRRNYSDENWRSYKSIPWSGNRMSGSYLDVRIKRRTKRNMYNERPLRVLWDEDGQTLEQMYVYSPDSPGLWVAETRRPLEQEMAAKGMDLPYVPDDPPRHPDIIRILKLNSETLILNHCSDVGDGGIFSLILRRSPSRIERAEWYDLQRQFFSFELPIMYRYKTICASCVNINSMLTLVMCIILLRML